MKTGILEKIKTWVIVGLFAIAFFGFMIFSYKYKNLNKQYEQVIQEQIDYKRIIDSLYTANELNIKIINDLNTEIETLNTKVSKLDKEKKRLVKKLKNSQNVVSTNMSEATKLLKKNLKNEKL